MLHLDAGSWSRLTTGQSGDLWWVHGFAGGSLFMGGAGGLILRYDESGFTRMDTPGTGLSRKSSMSVSGST